MKRRKRVNGLADWIEANIVLPDVVACGWPPNMRDIANAVTDPAVER